MIPRVVIYRCTFCFKALALPSRGHLVYGKEERKEDLAQARSSRT